MRRFGSILLIGACGLAVLTACSGGSTSSGTGAPGGGSSGSSVAGGTGTTAKRQPGALPAAYQGFTSDQYANGQHWLCRPGNATEDVCSRDLTATAVKPDGSTSVEPHTKAADPPVDCFYVYPTISNDPGLNSDLNPEEGNEVWAAVNQVSRLNSSCRVFAPVYRQLTLGSLVSRQAGKDDAQASQQARELAYGDVLAAWKHYMANDNNGRGVILVGHSQGAGVLKRLLVEEVDKEPALRDRLVSAYLLGTSVAVPDGKDVGGDLTTIPLCTKAGQVGCVVTYASFPASSPPPDNSLFGAAGKPGQVAGCTNPAALGGGKATVVPYFAAERPGEQGGAAALAGASTAITTPWVSPRDVFTAECVIRNGRSVLEVTLRGNPSDTRDQALRGGLPANWGSHLADANITMGNLEALAAAQAKAYTGAG